MSLLNLCWTLSVVVWILSFPVFKTHTVTVLFFFNQSQISLIMTVKIVNQSKNIKVVNSGLLGACAPPHAPCFVKVRDKHSPNKIFTLLRAPGNRKKTLSIEKDVNKS